IRRPTGNSPHLWAADRSICIGPPPASASYLQGQALIQAALATGCSAIYPGYGFLSEKADFRARCREAGLIFRRPEPGGDRADGRQGRRPEDRAG
ncbi:MAG: acetyl-CoA carboxylase biotin carboxylase subunit, partial [Rhodomicrobium sp.]|nr:acetyl-CoA carboxylase biotin carboxylase subunit [Rhodomicrobium sp.]